MMRVAISPEEKLAITLRFLATGESYIELDYNTKVSKTCLSLAIIDVCDAINKHFKDEVLKFPNSKEEWCRIVDDYTLKWQFPNCVGSIDGKHIAFRPTKKEAALFYNYKGYHSIVLLGVADAIGKFIFIDAGCNGRISDGGMLQRSHFNYILQQPENYLPSKKIIGNSRLLPYVFVGDNAFPLCNNLITPYTFTTTESDKKMFNYRLSRARQTIERAFGMLSNRFQIFQKSINLHQSKVKKIVLCCCVLHNFLITRSEYYSGEYNIGEQNRTTERMTDGPSKKNNSKYGESVRNELTQYFNNEGAL